MSVVKPKKKLGQHFLTDQNIARKIVDSLDTTVPDIIEVGPGMGVLTRFLLKHTDRTVFAIEIDPEYGSYLQKEFPEMEGRIIAADFLRWDTTNLPPVFSIIGNFPYNISSQIFFRILELKNQVPQVVGMVQKEVAE